MAGLSEADNPDERKRPHRPESKAIIIREDGIGENAIDKSLDSVQKQRHHSIIEASHSASMIDISNVNLDGNDTSEPLPGTTDAAVQDGKQ